MGLEAGAEVPKHVDIHYYWRTHLRIHIPVVTNPGVLFTSESDTIHMVAGECWILDSFYPHKVVNRGDSLRTHLVLDTVGSERIWDLSKMRRAVSERLNSLSQGLPHRLNSILSRSICLE
jgi:aspartyl/asparaginyl beta-hydroxylase (cupin superfamily)